jgi:hypothetical protein
VTVEAFPPASPPPGPSARWVNSTASLTLTGTLTDVPGLTMTLALAGTYLVVCFFDFDINATGQVGVGKLLVGGTQQTGEVHWINVNGRVTCGQQWVVAVAANTVIKMQASGGSGTIDSVHSTLTATGPF